MNESYAKFRSFSFCFTRRQTFPIRVAASLVFHNSTFIEAQIKNVHFTYVVFIAIFMHLCCHFQSAKANFLQKSPTGKETIQNVCVMFDEFLGNVTASTCDQILNIKLK